ncbi:MAG: porphobilinogen synthase [Alphaproteobacteria bacterium]|nr:porphobilinogen synthase [Alphaproteobacteria bacterium]
MSLSFTGDFPATRLRRTRLEPWSRALVAETRLHASDLILPLFVQEGENCTPVPTLPGVSRLPLKAAVETAQKAHDAGIPAVALFPVVPPDRKTPHGEEALNADNLICRAISTIKLRVPGLGVIADVALDPYTTHGHDGILSEAGHVDNDATVELLCRQALVQARAGCDVIAPSDMMDGRIRAIRAALEEAGFHHTLLLAYAAKYASGFYGPFRDAVGSAQSRPVDKRGYQLDAANSNEALREAALDVAEGADMLMVKPALPYLDILHRLSAAFPLPVLAYQVSGEYAMLHAAGATGALDGKEALLESLLCIKRAGARAIFTYAALEAAAAL